MEVEIETKTVLMMPSRSEVLCAYWERLIAC